jgi:uncharacterized protein (TIGR03089 family)
MGEPRDVPGLLTRLLDDPGRPRLTWYGPDAERVELSGKVLLNWVSKTANLLVDELDAGPGTTVGIELPPHWRSVTWVLATWAAGAHVVVAPQDPAGEPVPTDVLVTTDPRPIPDAPAGAHVVGVALPALATSFGPGLPDGALDAATEIRLQPDVFHPRQAPDAGDPAFTAAGRTMPYGDLVAAARTNAIGSGLHPGDRVLSGAGPEDAVVGCLGVLALDGSVVLHHDVGAATDALVEQEGVTRRR